MSALPFPKRASAEGVIESTYYYVLFQILNYEHDRTRTRITRCYTTAGEALNFVRHMVREWEPHVDRDWEEFSDDDDDDKEEEENKVLLRVTTKYPLPPVLPATGGARVSRTICVYCAAPSPRVRK